MRYFEDLVINQVQHSKKITVDKQQMLKWASEFDPQYFHSDEEKAKESVFKGLVAPGIYTLMLWRKLDHTINHDVKYVCGTGWEKVRWHRALRPNDTIYVTSKVVDKYPHNKRQDWGVAIYQYTVKNQNNDEVLSFTSHNLVERLSQITREV